MLLFKITGFLLIFSACTAIGILKSDSLKQRYQQLEEIIKSLSILAERIRLGGYERDELIFLSFGDSLKIDSNFDIKLTYGSLSKDDLSLLTEFFKGFGMTDKDSEYERAILYSSLLKERLDSANKTYKEQGKLYRTIGVMSGIVLCIFFM